MAVSILSYRSMASLTVIADAHLVPDPEAITREFNREFEKMLKSATTGAARNTAAEPRARKSPATRRPAA